MNASRLIGQEVRVEPPGECLETERVEAGSEVSPAAARASAMSAALAGRSSTRWRDSAQRRRQAGPEEFFALRIGYRPPGLDVEAMLAAVANEQARIQIGRASCRERVCLAV